MTEYSALHSATQQENSNSHFGEQGGQVIPFSGNRDLVSQEDLTAAVQLWRFERDLSEALTREELGGMKMMQRFDAQRKALLLGFAMYLRKHPRSDVAMGVYLVQTLMSDNDRGVSTVSQPTLAKLFGRSVSSIGDAQKRLKDDGLIVMGRGRYAGATPVIPRFVTEQYNHLTWIVAALANDEKPVNLPAPPVDCQSTGPTGGLSQSTGQTRGLKVVNQPVEGGSINRPDPMQLHSKNSNTKLHKAASVVAAGLATAIGALPVAADPPTPPAIIKAASPVSHKELSDKLFDAGGNAMNRTVPSLEYMSMPIGWLESGCDLELDILPVVRSMASRKAPQSIGSWKFFAGAVADARAARTAPMPEGRPRQKSQTATWHDEQEKLQRIWRELRGK